MKSKSAASSPTGLMRLCSFLLALALAACTSLKPGDVLPDASSAPGKKPSSNCKHYEPPGPPAKPTSPDLDRDFIFAGLNYDVGDTANDQGEQRFHEFGYDLDHTCTDAQTARSSCKPPKWAPPLVIDGPEGRDNSANDVLSRLAEILESNLKLAGVDASVSADSLQPANANPDSISGRNTFILRLRHYNGESDDDEIELDAFSGTTWNGPTGGDAPAWDGHDRWRLAQPWLKDGMLDNDAPRFADLHAYVADNVLVAHLDSLLVGAAFAPGARWRNLVVTAQIIRSPYPDNANHSIDLQDVVVAGRWPIDDFLTFASRTLAPDLITPKCQQPSIYTFSQPALCQHVDLNTDVDDGSGTCDAVSIVYNFDARRAELGDPIAIDLPVFLECGATDCSGRPLPPIDPSR